MSTDRDVERIVRSWLDEGVTALPDRVLDLVLDQLPATPQRRAGWLARRSPLMNNALRIASAAAVVLVVALIGIQLFGGTNVGGPGPSPSQSESPTLVPTPSPSATPPAAFPPAGAMEVGRHSMTLAGVPLSIELTTTGWISTGDFGIDKGNFQSGAPDSASLLLWPASAPDNVYADPCAHTPLDPPAGPSAAELAAAVSTVAGTELVSGPAAVTVGGYPAQHVVISIPDTIGCPAEQFYLWYDSDAPGDAPSGELYRYATARSTVYTWIIDVDGTIVWIEGETFATSGPEAAQEVQQIVDSIQFE
ncbi:MAG: hypothetical protein HYX57_07420 [Chloroflexi bacterium]|nr:hypothetical protein [Chloroflexota bacterium]